MAKLSDLLRTAEARIAAGDRGGARAVLEGILKAVPDQPQTLLRLSYLESLDGHYRAARECALRACAARPRDADAAQDLLRRLRTFNETAALRGYVDSLPPLARLGIPLLLTLAAQWSYLNEQDAALVYLDEARRGDPDHPPTLVSRGQVLTYLGRFDEAEEDLNRCTKRAPELASAWWALSRLRRQTPESNHIDPLRRQLALANKPDDVALLAFALHKELDDVGDYPAAAEALDQACRAKRSQLSYSSDESRALFRQLRAASARPTSAAGANASGGDGLVPIFIVGMHRSGTTLLEQLLDGHDEVRGLGELYDFTSQMRDATDHHCRGVVDATIAQRAVDVDFAAVGDRYLAGIAWRMRGERCFVDKLPSNFLNLDFVCRALPQAKILHMVRDPMETCFSNLRELFSDANPYSYDQSELADYHENYAGLMEHWHRRWPGRVLDVDYARLTREAETPMREVAAFCGLRFDEAMLGHGSRTRGVATASAVQVRGRIEARAQPKWKPYEDYLQPLSRALKQ